MINNPPAYKVPGISVGGTGGSKFDEGFEKTFGKKKRGIRRGLVEGDGEGKTSLRKGLSEDYGDDD